VASCRAEAITWHWACRAASRILGTPIWHFVLPGGQCGPGATLGVWMPSVDRVGRLFPLTLAWVGEESAPPADDGAWRAVAEAAGLAALHSDMAPEELAARLAGAPSPGGEALPMGNARWWTEGAPRVPAGSLTLDRLPEPGLFAGMLLAPRRETTP
jgi:type VI secretion system protein ImpM